MGAFAVGAVVLVPFPFSDLSGSKLRPAIVLAELDRGDWILCQVTSQPYADPFAVELTDDSLRIGTLSRTCFARPTRIFTANGNLIRSQVANLADAYSRKVVKALIAVLQTGLE